jgi:hypothetical protein
MSEDYYLPKSPAWQSLAGIRTSTPALPEDTPYVPKTGDLVTFGSADMRVYEIVQVTSTRVIYKELPGHYAESLNQLRRRGMEAL